MRTQGRLILVALVLVVVGVVPLLAKDKKGGATVADLAGRRKIDEFNPDVKDKDKGDAGPVRGGSIRIRIPTEPKSLNQINENGSQSRTITGLLHSPLIDRDRETFERFPVLAESWEVRDVLVLKGVDGKPKKIEGLALKRDDKGVTFAIGAGIFTFGKQDVASYTEKDTKLQQGLVILKDKLVENKTGRAWRGKVTVAGDKVVIAVDMAWHKKEDKSFPAASVKVFKGASYIGEVSEGVPGKKDSWTIKVKVIPPMKPGMKPSDVQQKYSWGQVEVDEEKIGKKLKRFPALRREVVMYFQIRSGVRWHDGQPLTAEDVVWSLSTIKNDAVDCEALRNYYRDIREWGRAGASGVRFEYGKQYFRALSFCGELYVSAKHRFQPEKFKGDPESFGKHFNTHSDHFKPVGNGPFRMSKWEKGVAIEVVRNEDWFVKHAGLPYINPERPYLDKISWVVINDKNASLKSLTNGAIDADFDIEPLSWRSDETKSEAFTKRFVRASFLQPLYTYIGWNQNRVGVDDKHQFFRDANVRRAMTMLIPRKTILTEIHKNLAQQVNGPFYRYGPFHNPKIKTIEYNPERAKVLLDRAGWIDHDGDGIRDKDGVKFEFDYLIHNARAYHQRIADIIKESVEQAGIKMGIKKLDWRVFGDTVRDHKFDAVRFAWGEPNCIEADPFQIWHSTSALKRGSNTISFNNQKADELMERVRRSLDFSERQKLLRRFHKILAREQPYTFLFNFYGLYCYSRKYRNVKFYIIGNDPYDLTEWFVPKPLQKS